MDRSHWRLLMSIGSHRQSFTIRYHDISPALLGVKGILGV